MGKVLVLDKFKTEDKESELERQLREGYEDLEYQRLMVELAELY